MLITLSNRFYKNFLPRKGIILLENGKTGFFCFTRVGEPALISKTSYLFGVEATWHTVLICCTMCGTGQPKEQPHIGDGDSNPLAINQVFFGFFSIGSTCSRPLFNLLTFFILRGLLYLI